MYKIDPFEGRMIMCIQSTAKIDIGTGISAISARYRATKRFDSNKHSNKRTSVYLKEQNIGAVFRLSSIKPQNLGFEKLVPKLVPIFGLRKKQGSIKIAIFGPARPNQGPNFHALMGLPFRKKVDLLF